MNNDPPERAVGCAMHTILLTIINNHSSIINAKARISHGRCPSKPANPKLEIRDESEAAMVRTNSDDDVRSRISRICVNRRNFRMKIGSQFAGLGSPPRKTRAPN